MKNKRYCFTLDLKNNKHLISEYIDYHKKVWPEIIQSIRTVSYTHLTLPTMFEV